MTRSEPQIDIAFPLVFHVVVITASTATSVWVTSEPEVRGLLSNWPPLVVWLSLAATVIQYAEDRTWWRYAAGALVVSTAMMALCMQDLRGG